MNLLIAEKPKQAKEYEKMLIAAESEKFVKKEGYLQGNEWQISWCIGHLGRLAKPNEMGIPFSLESLPIFPDDWKLLPSKGKEKQLKVVSSLMKKSDLIVNGTDDGREGELIFDNVLQMCFNGNNNHGKSIKRLKLSSFVIADMVKAWNNLVEYSLCESRVLAGRLRSRGDWLVGMNFSTGYSLATRSSISVGRVQTPTLKLVVDQDERVESAKDVYYYQLEVLWNKVVFSLIIEDNNKFDKNTIPEASLSKLKKGGDFITASIIKSEGKDKSKSPDKPFYLTTLQQQANKSYNLTPKETLSIAQGLYEKGYISYPRTDCEYLPEGMKKESFEFLNGFLDTQQKSFIKEESNNFVFFNDAKISDHFAIVPLQIDFKELTGNDKLIYELVCQRFCKAFGRPYKYQAKEYLLEADDLHFIAKTNTATDLGYRGLFPNEKKDLPSFNIGDTDKIESAEVVKKKEKKPSYFTLSDLQEAMKTAGKKIDDENLREAMRKKMLGTAATQGDIIENLFTKEYLQSNGKSIVSTLKGRQLISLVDERVSSPEMTGEWEYRLRQVEEGKLSADKYMNALKKYISSIIPEFSKDLSSMIDDHDPDCPKCSEGKIKKGKKGLYCNNRECKVSIPFKILSKKITQKNITDLFEKKETELIKGFKKKDSETVFSAKLIFDDEFNLKFSFPKKKKEETSIKCPACEKGKLIKFDAHMGCSEYSSGCKFSLPLIWSNKKLSMEDLTALAKNGATSMLKGFKSQKGKKYNAKLLLDKDFNLAMEFEKKK